LDRKTSRLGPEVCVRTDHALALARAMNSASRGLPGRCCQRRVRQVRLAPSSSRQIWSVLSTTLAVGADSAAASSCSRVTVGWHPASPTDRNTPGAHNLARRVRLDRFTFLTIDRDAEILNTPPAYARTIPQVRLGRKAPVWHSRLRSKEPMQSE